jgi:hypothetical protein
VPPRARGRPLSVSPSKLPPYAIRARPCPEIGALATAVPHIHRQRHCSDTERSRTRSAAIPRPVRVGANLSPCLQGLR